MLSPRSVFLSALIATAVAAPTNELNERNFCQAYTDTVSCHKSDKIVTNYEISSKSMEQLYFLKHNLSASTMVSHIKPSQLAPKTYPPGLWAA